MLLFQISQKGKLHLSCYQVIFVEEAWKKDGVFSKGALTKDPDQLKSREIFGTGMAKCQM